MKNNLNFICDIPYFFFFLFIISETKLLVFSIFVDYLNLIGFLYSTMIYFDEYL